MANHGVIFGTALTADAASPSDAALKTTGNMFLNNTMTFWIGGTIDTATVTLHISYNEGTTWIPLNNYALTAAGAIPIAISKDAKYGITITGGGTESINAGLI